MSRKRFLTVLMVAAAIVLLGGFAAAQAIYIPVISKGFQHQFWQAVRIGAEKAAKDYKVVITFEGPENESMVDKQLDMLQTDLAKNPSAIVLRGPGQQGRHPPAPGGKEATRSRSSALTQASTATSPSRRPPLTTWRRQRSRRTRWPQLIGGSGKVGVIIHDQTSRTGIDRGTGFLSQMKKKYPNIQIIGPQYGGGDQLKSTDLAKAMIQANPDIKGFFGGNEGSIIGVLNAVKELDLVGKVVVIGYDSGKQQLDAIRSGEEAGAITQDPIGIGYKAVEAAVKAIRGQKVPKSIDTGFHWFDKTNIDDPAIAAVLYN